MKRISFPFISVVIIVLGLFSFGYSERGIQVQEKRFALVIGNGSYKSSPLKNPTNDAHDMASVLETLGFEVTHLENAEHRTMERAIRKFGKQLRNGGAGLFYFAGHGIQVNGRNYLIPVDAEIETESDVKFEGVDAGRVLGKMDDAGNDLNIVILDACRDNPFSRSFRTSNQGLARMDAPKGSLIAYATAPGSIAADGEGRNGIYTKYLLKYAKTPGLTVEQILKKVRVEVLKETNNKQIPWESSSLTGNFSFNPVKSEMKPSIVEPQQTPQITQQDGLGEKYETLFWDSIKDSKEAEKFKAYLKKFPNGVFVDLARMNIKKYSHQIEEKPAEKLSADIPAGFSVSEAKEAGRDGTFIAYTTGVVYDEDTGLEWYAGPDKDTTWNEAKRWIESLNVAGNGWRMPAIKELKTLYKPKAGTSNMTSLLKFTGLYVWSINTKSSSSSWSFAFHRGSESWAYHNYSSKCRSFAVRTRK